MRLTIFGATGGTGRCLVEQALEGGHEVTAVVRDPRRLSIQAQSGLTVVTANVMEPSEIAAAVDEAGAVVSALGPRGRGPTTVASDSTASIIEAMQKTGASRLVTISGSIVDDTGDGFLMRRVVKPLARRTFLRAVCADMRIAEDEIHASPLDWTIVRPPRLTDKAPTGRYRVGLNQNLPHGTTIPRPDLATCVLALVDDPAMIHEHVFVAS